jgi:hypothetical protein
VAIPAEVRNLILGLPAFWIHLLISKFMGLRAKLGGMNRSSQGRGIEELLLIGSNTPF